MSHMRPSMMTDDTDDRAFFHNAYREAVQIVNQISPLLAGRGQFTQGVTLALLVTKWICGHHAIGTDQDTLQVRQQMLELFIQAVEDFASLENESLLEQVKPEGRA